MTKLLATFVMVGVVDSKDDFFATVEINSSPPVVEAAMAVIPLHAFPCEIKEGDQFYILKLTEDKDPVIICGDYDDRKNHEHIGE